MPMREALSSRARLFHALSPPAAVAALIIQQNAPPRRRHTLFTKQRFR
jgi:hypothetical protein